MKPPKRKFPPLDLMAEVPFLNEVDEEAMRQPVNWPTGLRQEMAMSDQTQRDDLVERLRRVESGSPRGEFTTNWYRNPDGPEAADRIERLERALRLAKLAILTWSPCPEATIQEADDALKGQEG